ncbi:MAG: hypothetical protein ACI9WU_003104, partial [Myxococcota bacterium]
CTTGVCVKGQIEQKALTGPCSDGDPCTVGDSCTLGQCVPDALTDCPAQPCAQTAWCDPDVGACVYDPVLDGTACNLLGADPNCAPVCTAGKCACTDVVDPPDPVGECAAVVLDGQSCIQIEGALEGAITDLTIEFWLRPQASGSQFVLDKIVNQDVNQVGFRIRYDTVVQAGALHYEQMKQPSNLHGSLSGVDSFPAGEWHHYALTRSSTGLIRRYVDGVSNGPSSFSQWIADQSNTTPLYVGCQDMANGFLTADMDELRISSTLRYTGNSFPVPPGPFDADADTLALYHFDEGTGSTVIDSSGNGLNGTWIGNAAWTDDAPVLKPQCQAPAEDPEIFDLPEGVNTVMVPAGVNAAHVQVWGGGGGSGYPGEGGAGAWVKGIIPVAGGDSLEVRVAGGGVAFGGGGGASYVFKNGEVMLVAGGGGGAGSDGCIGCNDNWPDGSGGGGGPLGGSAQDGTANNQWDTNSGAGLGATQSAGGAGGLNTNTSQYDQCELDGNAGAANAGGHTAGAPCKVNDQATWQFAGKQSGGNGTGGGGGSGHFGGGAGASKWTYTGGGGGGGSSYAHPSVTATQSAPGSLSLPGGMQSPHYDGVAGKGGTPGLNGGPAPVAGQRGLIILEM